MGQFGASDKPNVNQVIEANVNREFKEIDIRCFSVSGAKSKTALHKERFASAKSAM